MTSPAPLRPRTRSPLARVAQTVLNVAAACGVLIAIIAIAGLVFGVRPVIFTSGSMAPSIGTGALAVTAPVAAEDIRTGDVITVPRGKDGVLVTHRVTEVERGEYGRWLLRLQGDANPAPDAETYDVTAGAARVIWHAEGWGRVLASLDSMWIAGAVIALVAIAVWPARRPKRGAALTSTAPGPTDPVAAGN
jgi:signal peptidase